MKLIKTCVRYVRFIQHPGGGELILDVAGKDCTKEFDDFGHSSDARQIMKKFKIGELVEVYLILSKIIDQNNSLEISHAG